MQESSINRRGFGLGTQARSAVESSCKSSLVENLRETGGAVVGGVTVRLARSLGFCYGVERAVEYAYQARQRFPERRLFLAGEIVHNPRVNGLLEQLGIVILEGHELERFAGLRAGDVVLVPAFGLPVGEVELLSERGCVIVDTTCGSVLNVWKNVERYAREGFTSLIHGKLGHEETRATCSRVTNARGHFVVVRDLEEARVVSAAITGELEASGFHERLGGAVSAGFRPERDLRAIGCANQTTMLARESLAMADLVREALAQRYGANALAKSFRTFDTICSATQDRQDAVLALLEEKPDVFLVVGGYASSNTGHLAELASTVCPAYHVEDATALFSRERVRHLPVGKRAEELAEGWLPEGARRIGVTSGASTPDAVTGEVLTRLFEILRSEA